MLKKLGVKVLSRWSLRRLDLLGDLFLQTSLLLGFGMKKFGVLHMVVGKL